MLRRRRAAGTDGTNGGLPMAGVVVFHSALGLRPAIETFAGRLREDGHEVWTPDLFAGSTFDDVDAGVAEVDRLGMEAVLARAAEAVDPLPAEVVYLGISLGCMPAMQLSATRPGARGVVQVQSVVTPEDFDLPGWPEQLPVQLHVSPDDPWQDDVDQLVPSVPDGLLDVHTYPDTQHVFMDDELAVYDPAATERFTAAVLGWLAAR
ncbi:dienelactone hydrolase family protein [Egicoccus sp. AB-alg2]|uniref:dienelactone hydrolase family protein n=1 Tax=Egicoccus sp. AB-alg2 TaxID=3242693 RepID=UPI00359CFDD3